MNAPAVKRPWAPADTQPRDPADRRPSAPADTQPWVATAAPALRACSLVSAAGHGLQAWASLLRDNRSALARNGFTHTPLATWVGAVEALDVFQLPAGWPAAWALADCRALRLAFAGLQADGFMAAARSARDRYGAQRVGLALGTSASTIGASEEAYRQIGADGGAPAVFPAHLRHPRLNTLHALAEFVQHCLGVAGPCVTVSTACSSSAKVFAVAQRWLALGLVDAVVVGGVDALCHSVMFGFHALQLLSATPCQPFAGGAPSSKGISIGEAAGFVLLERPLPGDNAVHLVGYGEANDAHHMSSPHPQGLGAEAALHAALARAGWSADSVQVLQLHGTGTALNDAVEAALVARCYSPTVHASASKGSLGHTMGAAGIVGALACVLALRDGLCAGTPGTGAVDTALPAPFADQLRLLPQQCSEQEMAQRTVQRAACHAFGFGGNNCVLLFSRGTAGGHAGR